MHEGLDLIGWEGRVSADCSDNVGQHACLPWLYLVVEVEERCPLEHPKIESIAHGAQ